MSSQHSTIYLVVPGRTPSKKNKRISLVIRGRAINIPSNDYRAWHKGALQSLITQNLPPTSLETVKEVELCFYAENRRKFDLSNKAESIMDLLVDVGVLKDDNYEVVPKLILIYGGQDKQNPRCTIKITI